MKELESFESSLKRRKMIMNVVWGLIVLSPFALIGHCVYKTMTDGKGGGDVKLDKDDISLMEERFQSALAEATRRDEAFRSGFAAAAGKVNPGTGVCRIRLDPPESAAKTGGPKELMLSGFSYHRVKSVAELPTSFVLKRTNFHVEAGRKQIKRGFRDEASRRRFIDKKGPLAGPGAYEVVFVVTRDFAPFVDQSLTTFRAGSVDGTAYIWDHASGEIVCAGNISATNSERVSAKYRIGGANLPSTDIDPFLREDLRIETERAIAAGMRDAVAKSP